MKKLLSISLTAIALTSCATAAQKEVGRIIDINKTTTASVKACHERLANDPQFTALKTKLYMNMSPDLSPPLAYLTNAELPTQTELKLLTEFYDKSSECRSIVISGTAQMHPLLQMAASQCFSSKTALMATYVEGKTSWGNINKGMIDASQKCAQNFSEAASKIGSNLQAENQIEQQQRAAAMQQAGAAMQAYSAQMQAQSAAEQQNLLQQQQLMQMNRPVTTNCYHTGNNLSCTSY